MAAWRYEISYDARLIKPATYLAILYADRSEFDRQRKLRANFATDCLDTLGDFLRRSRRFNTSISFPDYNQLTLVAIRSDERKKSLKAKGPTWRMPANLIADI